MIRETGRIDNSRQFLSAFVYGSFVVLLVCLLSTAFILSTTYLKKEQKRAEISRDQMFHFFDFQYRAFTEEMWTKNYEGIRLRVGSIAKQLGHADYDVLLADDLGQCVYSSKGPGTCAVPLRLVTEIPKFATTLPEPVIEFDKLSKRYAYMVPLYVGATLKGYLYSSISDPYEFYRGGNVDLALKMLAVPIACVVVVWLIWLLISQHMILRPYMSSIVDLQKKKAVGEMAAQVAHDILSPVTVLKSVIKDLRGIGETERRLITTAANRVESIANDLVTKFTGSTDEESGAVSFVSSVVDAAIVETRVLLGEASRIEIQSLIPSDLRMMTVPISATRMSRVLSNIINNSIDALRETQAGHINIVVSARPGGITISITDNGKGIPADVLGQIRSVGGTYGKMKGAGMGLQGAKATLGKVGGSLSIDSLPGDGTTVTLEMPTVPLPPWCAQVLDLSDATLIVVLDDDPSVHLLWRERLGTDGVTYLTDPEEFDISRYPLERTRFILDYEIAGSPVTGLDLITSHKLGCRAVLVTSYFNEPRIQKAVEQAGARILPKPMITTIGICLTKNESSKGPPAPGNRSCDLVLIDDDLMLHDLWRHEASRRGLVMEASRSSASLNLSTLNRKIPIYVDLNLDGDSGMKVVEDLHAQGFSNISLATAQKVIASQVPKYIREIRNKDFPVVIGRDV